MKQLSSRVSSVSTVTPMVTAMTVTLYVPAVLQPRCDGKSRLVLCGDTVRGVLTELEQEYPALHSSICNETGAIRPHVNVFVNNAVICKRTELDVVLNAGDALYVFQAVSGG